MASDGRLRLSLLTEAVAVANRLSASDGIVLFLTFLSKKRGKYIDLDMFTVPREPPEPPVREPEPEPAEPEPELITLIFITTIFLSVAGGFAPSSPPANSQNTSLIAAILSTLGFQDLAVAAAADTNLSGAAPITIFALADRVC
ncbi:hypothetical protein CASFOL_041462 [Castilleja foliolosa]|uniref:Uncharacterized protein n=1 Tax=Castilleja foliolosa TaxID=1961234 RepID=A0ABD3BBE6_9LAMI